MQGNISGLSVGATATFTKIITKKDVRDFAIITGDTNPIHMNDVYAATTRFGKCVVHGFLVAGLVSAVLGTELPGPGSIYLSQSLRFIAPVYPGDEITALSEVVRIREDKPIVTFRTTCTNQRKQLVLEGEAVLLVPVERIHGCSSA